MSEFTDFLIKVDGERELIEFRHTVSSVREIYELDGEFIEDLYGFQIIRKSEILSVRLDPRPYVWKYMGITGRCVDNSSELWMWVNSLDSFEREDIKDSYYNARRRKFNYYE